MAIPKYVLAGPHALLPGGHDTLAGAEATAKTLASAIGKQVTVLKLSEVSLFVPKKGTP